MPYRVDPITQSEAVNWDEDTPLDYLHRILRECPAELLDEVEDLAEATLEVSVPGDDLYTVANNRCDARGMPEITPFVLAETLLRLAQDSEF